MLNSLGNSLLHNSRSRGLAETDSSMQSLRDPPPAHTALKASALAPVEEAVSSLGLPTAMHWPQAPWRAVERWSSEAALREHYGGLQFSLGPDVKLSLADYISYAQSTTVDFPYYICERDFSGEKASLLDDFRPPPRALRTMF